MEKQCTLSHFPMLYSVLHPVSLLSLTHTLSLKSSSGSFFRPRFLPFGADKQLKVDHVLGGYTHSINFIFIL